MVNYNFDYDLWVETYKPIVDKFGSPKLFDTSEDLVFLKAQNPLNIWSDLECDGVNYIENGASWVNSLGCYVTEIPFDKNDLIQIKL